jgi:hypothetical protein
VKKCLEVLREAVKALPEGDLKTQAESAVKYLEETATGEPQPKDGIFCPGTRVIILPGG